MSGKQGRSGRGSSAPQYIGGSSDKRYLEETQHRLRQQAWKRWVMRLVILAVLAVAAKVWGLPLLHQVTHRGEQTVDKVAAGGRGLKASVDERSGANLKDDQ